MWDILSIFDRCACQCQYDQESMCSSFLANIDPTISHGPRCAASFPKRGDDAGDEGGQCWCCRVIRKRDWTGRYPIEMEIIGTEEQEWSLQTPYARNPSHSTTLYKLHTTNSPLPPHRASVPTIDVQLENLPTLHHLLRNCSLENVFPIGSDRSCALSDYNNSQSRSSLSCLALLLLFAK